MPDMWRNNVNFESVSSRLSTTAAKLPNSTKSMGNFKLLDIINFLGLQSHCTLHFLTPFLPSIALISVFAAQMALLGLLPRFLSFITPVISHLFPGLLQAIGRERVHPRGYPREYPKGRSTKNLWSSPGSNPGHLDDRWVLCPLRYATNTAKWPNICVTSKSNFRFFM